MTDKNESSIAIHGDSLSPYTTTALSPYTTPSKEKKRKRKESLLNKEKTAPDENETIIPGRRVPEESRKALSKIFPGYGMDG